MRRLIKKLVLLEKKIDELTKMGISYDEIIERIKK